MRWSSRIVGGALLLGGGLAVGRHVAKVVAATRDVAPQYSTPWLLAPDFALNARVVGLMRGVQERPAQIADGVVITDRIVVGAEGHEIRVWVYDPEVRAAAGAAGAADPVAGDAGLDDAAIPALLYIHGGGFVIGDPAGYHDRCSRIAAELGIRVVSVDYRLAPEHPFPAALDDCLDVLRWMHATADESGIDAARIAVGGDSAGGGLAACTVQAAVDDDVPVAFQLLIYPMLDDRTLTRGHHAGTGRFVWSVGSNRFGWTSYLGTEPGADAVPPYAAGARRDDVSGLPPAWIGVGSLDLFHEEDRVYAERLRAAGVDADLLVMQGAFHGFDRVVPDAPGSEDFQRAMLDALARGLGVSRG